MTTYRDAGVDIDAAEEAVRRMGPLIRETFTPGVLSDIGAFGGFFELDTSNFARPVLVSSVDGVGTKLKVAIRVGRHDTIGQDLVHHCVNDIAVCGAEPLFFLDYFSTGVLEPDVAEQLMRGLAKACRACGCALIGGETAEMPDIYAPGEYDLAGMVVGVVEKEEILKGSRIQVGDILLGVRSSGLHTNGYSLARRVLLGAGGSPPAYAITDTPSVLGGVSIGEALLRVHRSYLPIIRSLRHLKGAHAFAHVTGGGIEGNIARMMPEGLGFEVDFDACERPALFRLIEQTGAVPDSDMRRTFNLGIGLVAIAASDSVDAMQTVLRAQGEDAIIMGHVTRARKQVGRFA